MSEHFNRLTPAAAEALALLAEECGEAIQVIGKILRHGLYSTHPDGGPDNRSLLEGEIGDLMAALDILRRLDIVRQTRVDIAAAGKLQRVGKYLHHIALP
jgi:hypothetical protein